MSEVLLKTALSSGEWYECSGTKYGDHITFRLRVEAMDVTTVATIDEDLIDDVEIEGALWLMRVQIVSLNKGPLRGCRVADMLELVDSDGFHYPRYKMFPLVGDRPSGLMRFADTTDAPPILPKIAIRGAVAFELPDQAAEYAIGVATDDGRVVRV